MPMGIIITFLHEIIMSLLSILSLILSHQEFVVIAISLEDRVLNGWNIASNNISELSLVKLLFGNTLSNDSIVNDNLYFYTINNFGILFIAMLYVIIIKLVSHNSRIMLLLLLILFGGMTLDILENLSFQVYFFILLFLLSQDSFKNKFYKVKYENINN